MEIDAIAAQVLTDEFLEGEAQEIGWQEEPAFVWIDVDIVELTEDSLGIRGRKIEARDRMQAESYPVVSAAVEMIQDILKQVRKTAFAKRVVIERLIVDSLEQGLISDGSVFANIFVYAPVKRVRGTLKVEMPVIDGDVHRPEVFKDTLGRVWPLSDSGICAFLGIDKVDSTVPFGMKAIR